MHDTILDSGALGLISRSEYLLWVDADHCDLVIYISEVTHMYHDHVHIFSCFCLGLVLLSSNLRSFSLEISAFGPVTFG